VERKSSLAKRFFGPGLIKTKLDTTTMSSVSLSIIAMNVDRLMTCSFFDLIRYISESVFRVVFRIFIADAGVKTRLEIETI